MKVKDISQKTKVHNVQALYADEFSNGRQRTVNYVQICNSFADSYPESISHGVQKDAIQNGIDAVEGKGPLNMEFALVENEKGRFFTMTDSNTLGLTGPVCEDAEDYEEDLPEDYHWARFESFAFTKKSLDAIGARGQGKFIFLSASKKYLMYYDSRRGDGIYRVGGTRATRTGCPILPSKGEKWEGDYGAARLNQRCGLEPLKVVGTRVIIVEPIDELVEAMENGSFVRAIQETWFRAIEKKRAIITVCHSGRSEEVTLPFPHPLPRRDSSDHKVWPVKNEEIRLTTNESYRIKHFIAIYLNSGKVPEEMQGIAIIHNGMKITSLPMNSAPPNVRERVTGFIEFDRALDRELRKGQNQHPNHYDLKWKRRIPHAIKAFVNEQLEAFGRAKLGLHPDPREVKNRRRTNAEDWAMRQLMRYAPNLDLFGARGPKPPPPPPPPPTVKSIGVSISNFVFPDPEIAPRVNWGQRFTDLGVTAYNNKEKTREVWVMFQVLYGDLPVLTLIDRERFILLSKGQNSFGPFEIMIEKDVMNEPGEYRLVASLFDASTGNKLDRVARRFWVEKNPPFRKPFELSPAPGFPEPYQRRQWFTTGSINNSPVVHYNVEHPAYKLAEDGGEEQQQDYLFQVTLEAAIDFVLKRPNQKDGTPDYHPLEMESVLGSQKKPVDREEVPATTYGEIARFVSETRWRMMEGE